MAITHDPVISMLFLAIGNDRMNDVITQVSGWFKVLRFWHLATHEDLVTGGPDFLVKTKKVRVMVQSWIEQ